MESLRESIQERAKHKREYDRRMSDTMMQSKERKDNSSKALDVGLVVTKSNETESERHVLSSRSGNDTHTDDADINSMQSKEGKVDSRKALDVDLVVTESSGTESEKHDTRSRPGNDIHVEDAVIKLANEKEPMAKMQSKEGKVDSRKALDVDLVVTESSGTESEKHDTRSRPGNDIHVEDAVIKLANEKEPMAKRICACKTPHHVIAPGSSRNSSKELYASNEMAHNYYLEEAKKKTQDKNKNLKPREMSSARTHHTPNTCTPKPRSNNQTSRNWHASMSSEKMLKAVQKAYHSRNTSSFLDSKHFVCLTCQKCIFNANHDACITKFPKEVNSRVKVQSPKTRNSNKPVEPNIHTQKCGRKIVTGHRFSPNKSSDVLEKTNILRSCLRWIPTGRIFNIVVLWWVPTRKIFTSSTTKVDCEPSNVPVAASPRAVDSADSLVSTSIDQDAPSTKPKNFKQAMTEPSWIDAMQEEIHEFERLQVWELVSCPNKVMLIRLKWIYKFKTDEFGGVIKNKARLVAQGFKQEEEDIQCAGFDTQPPVLDRTDFASWQQRIRLYCRGKENEMNILKSIDEGPFQMGTFRETLAEGNEGALHLGPE
nr:retrovirus-related Pol polyprotein from transposon TNT 1-94 [Tanacetum cinerariifolium]